MRLCVQCAELPQTVQKVKLKPEEITEEVVSVLSGYTWNPGSGSSDPYKRRTQIVQLSALAACLYGILFYRCSVAGFYKSRNWKRRLSNIIEETAATEA